MVIQFPIDWYDKKGNHVHAIVTKYSPNLNDLDIRNKCFKERPLDMEIRDRFIAQTGNVLDPKKMKFWSLPQGVLHAPLFSDFDPFC
jgi:hypothetical protein